MENHTNTTTLPVTLGGETREVEFTNIGSAYYAFGIIAARIGNGDKLHRAELVAWEYENVDAARNHGYAQKNIFEVNGKVFALSMVTHARNRRALVVGWADKYEGTGIATKQNYYGSL